MNCREAVAALVASIENGDTLTPEQRKHLKECERCRALFDSAKHFDASAAEPLREPALDEAAIATEVKQLRRREFFRRAWAAALVAMLITAALTVTLGSIEDIQARDIVIVGLAAALAAAVPVLIFYAVLISLRDRNGNRIHKRLKKGRAVSGVCLGLSEATGAPVNLLRLAFIALTFIKGVGLLLYIVLDLAMPVHPDDRQHLLRFKIRRWFQRRRPAH
ncbi:MAG TPA: PspC domain-containing protein [Thermoanaerobaculia bacterium]|nr:PspC domain-containing protein [Thermoanaerobaculia bacterium]